MESMELCGICGVHLESMGEGKIHFMALQIGEISPKTV
jgi:hypothetical protein